MSFAPDNWERQRASLIQDSSQLGLDGRDAVRFADLALARAYAEGLALVPPAITESQTDAQSISAAIEEIAMHPVPAIKASRESLARIANAACELSSVGIDADLLYRWSASSQASDPGRKGKGAYSTPPPLAERMARDAVPTAGKHQMRVIDPSAGHGALLLAVFHRLLAAGIDAASASRALYGVELDPNARELCCLMLWLGGAGGDGIELGELAGRIIVGNTLTARWSSGQAAADALPGFEPQHPEASDSFVWEAVFHEAFEAGGFDVVITNPPWESLRHRPESTSEDWAAREATRERLSTAIPTWRGGLPPLFSKQSRGDRNLYKGFVELVPHLLNENGAVVALIPGAFASDLGMAELRRLYLDHMAIDRWTSFENLSGYFPIDGRFKFGVLVARRSASGTRKARFRFLARDAADMNGQGGHVAIGREELKKLGGAATMFPEIADRREVEILLRAFEVGTPFFDSGGSFGQVSYRREVDLTLDRDSFVHVGHATRVENRDEAHDSWMTAAGEKLVPLIEGRMVGAYDFFQKSWRSGRGRSAEWTENCGVDLSECQPQYLASRHAEYEPRLAICDVTSATNTRTMLASWIPRWRCGNTAPVLVTETTRLSLALLAVLNSMTFDWILRRIAAGLHLNRFYLEAMRLPSANGGQVDHLASFAVSRILEDQRFQELPEIDREPLLALESSSATILESTVEAIVARGFGLSSADLQHMLRPDVEDRKGMWRFFASEPNALEIAKRSVEELAAA